MKLTSEDFDAARKLKPVEMTAEQEASWRADLHARTEARTREELRAAMASSRRYAVERGEVDEAGSHVVDRGGQARRADEPPEGLSAEQRLAWANARAFREQSKRGTPEKIEPDELGMSPADFDALSPEAKLLLANQALAAKKRQSGNA